MTSSRTNGLDSSGDDESELDGSISKGSSSSSSVSTERVIDDAPLALAKTETAVVTKLRLLVFVILVMASVSISLIVYYITAKIEQQEFETQFTAAAEALSEAFVGISKSRLGAISSLAVAMVAHGIDHRKPWPFVSVSSFQHRSLTTKKQSGAMFVQVTPVVNEADRYEWEYYVTYDEERKWIDEARQYQAEHGTLGFLSDKDILLFREKPLDLITVVGYNASILPIWHYNQDGERIIESESELYFPVWQTSPSFLEGDEVNENILKANHTFAVWEAYTSRSVVISEFFRETAGGLNSPYRRTAFFSLMISTEKGQKVNYTGEPISCIYFPVFTSFERNRRAGAFLSAWIRWSYYFERVLPANMQGITVVISDACGGVHTYSVNGRDVENIGEGDWHEKSYTALKISASFASVSIVDDGTIMGIPFKQEKCPFQVEIYPSSSFYNTYKTNTPFIITFAVSIVFIFTVFMFVLYDRLVERRQAIVFSRAAQTTRIVNSLFPTSVADRLIQAASTGEVKKKESRFVPATRRLQGFLNELGEVEENEKPIADLFPHCTVLFADIAGFTAWSSSRNPAHVFVLLQTIYQAFDAIAKRRKVFKVETIGDSYVAVTGLPDPQEKHAINMARFAGEIMAKMNQLASEMESSLGPDTADLTMRIGLHSGPVTAGVLIGERARFQLFGDTVNTAARMESTGIKKKIQVSQATHDLLVNEGKAHWLCPRSESVEAKGKGTMKTYWLTPTARKSSTASGSSTSADAISNQSDNGKLSAESVVDNNFESRNANAYTRSASDFNGLLKHDRLVDWISDLFVENMKKIVSMRKPESKKCILEHQSKTTPLDEVAEIIHLPRYNAKIFEAAKKRGVVSIDPAVSQQLRNYVSIVSSTYRKNHFHNFEHACHVTMAVDKFIKRIVSPNIDPDTCKSDVELSSKLHDYTYGITSDPLTVLAILFSALIHDADHRGVSNAQLIQEEKGMAAMYNNKSVAEQNSVDIAWNLLMGSDQFAALRACWFSCQEDLNRFRQVVVNVVLATDIFDKELNELRTNRWKRAFGEQGSETGGTWNNRRATIVIEHIIQASDVAHIMQHWHVYRKWNKRLFLEMYTAYQSGRMGKDPSTFWYEGELSFFDNYVIPLAKKLKDCNVFGVSSDECLNYAMQNRNEWADRGQEIVAEMMSEIREMGLFSNSFDRVVTT